MKSLVNQIIQGDALVELKKLPNNSVDLFLTDPPYQLSSIQKRYGKKNSVAAKSKRKGGNDGFQGVNKGFMGKEWDVLPSKEIWAECLRVLKDGAFAFIMMTPRQDSLWRCLSDLEAVGFQISFTSIYWTYASGFPKALNIGKAVDKKLGIDNVQHKGKWNFDHGDLEEFYKRKKEFKKQPDEKLKSKQAQELSGSYGGFQPKPAVEVILVAMKPLSEKTYVSQALKNRKGIVWFDDCRIPFETTQNPATNPLYRKQAGYKIPAKGQKSKGVVKFTSSKNEIEPKGRFPANLLVSDDVLNEGKIHTSGKGHFKEKYKMTEGFMNNKPILSDAWYGDSGSFSRYFSLDKWAETLPFLIVPKASKSEKNKGCENLEGNQHNTGSRTYDDVCANCGKKLVGDKPFRCECDEKITQKRITKGNFHPTVKPVKLMAYLIKLGSRENDVVLDCFAGSGTTGVACKMLARKYILIEKEVDYIKIAKKRLGQELLL